MAQVPDNLFQNWQDGEIVTATKYKLERDTLRVAGNDTDTRVTTLTTRVATNEGTTAGNTSAISGLQTLKMDKGANHTGTWQGLNPSDFDSGQQALNLGNLADLTTVAKNNLVAAVNEVDADLAIVNAKVDAIKPDPYFTFSYWMSM